MNALIPLLLLEVNVVDFLINHAKDIGTFLAGLVTGAAGGSLVTIRLSRKNQLTGDGSIADQSRARAGGDVVGRDKTVSTRS